MRGRKAKATHAIEDRNVLRFHVDYYKPEGKNKPKPGEALAKKAIVEAILEKHHAATNERKFNATLATASINDAIAYHELFKTIQAERQAADSDFQPLNIACVFSPPAEGNKDVQQIQEDLPQEKADNEQAPDEKKAALKARGGTFQDLVRMSNKADATTMKQAIKRALVPKLRFPEFRDAGEWKAKELGTLCKISILYMCRKPHL